MQEGNTRANGKMRALRRLTDALNIYLIADGSHSSIEDNESAWAATRQCVREIEGALEKAPSENRTLPTCSLKASSGA